MVFGTQVMLCVCAGASSMAFSGPELAVGAACGEAEYHDALTRTAYSLYIQTVV